MSSLDPEQVAVLGNAGGMLMQADEAGQSAVTVVLRSLQDLERLVKEASSKDVRDGSVPCHISITSATSALSHQHHLCKVASFSRRDFDLGYQTVLCLCCVL